MPSLLRHPLWAACLLVGLISCQTEQRGSATLGQACARTDTSTGSLSDTCAPPYECATHASTVGIPGADVCRVPCGGSTACPTGCACTGATGYCARTDVTDVCGQSGICGVVIDPCGGAVECNGCGPQAYCSGGGDAGVCGSCEARGSCPDCASFCAALPSTGCTANDCVASCQRDAQRYDVGFGGFLECTLRGCQGRYTGPCPTPQLRDGGWPDGGLTDGGATDAGAQDAGVSDAG